MACLELRVIVPLRMFPTTRCFQLPCDVSCALILIMGCMGFAHRNGKVNDRVGRTGMSSIANLVLGPQPQRCLQLQSSVRARSVAIRHRSHESAAEAEKTAPHRTRRPCIMTLLIRSVLSLSQPMGARVSPAPIRTTTGTSFPDVRSRRNKHKSDRSPPFVQN